MNMSEETSTNLIYSLNNAIFELGLLIYVDDESGNVIFEEVPVDLPHYQRLILELYDARP